MNRHIRRIVAAGANPILKRHRVALCRDKRPAVHRQVPVTTLTKCLKYLGIGGIHELNGVDLHCLRQRPKPLQHVRRQTDRAATARVD